ncbi:hypothetical protein FRB94_011705 [Tulasnella sp. JGI-2019a]|nr:hypothetical protein FRB94_011705 [Tulasnella sp. JGI-2019a]
MFRRAFIALAFVATIAVFGSARPAITTTTTSVNPSTISTTAPFRTTSHTPTLTTASVPAETTFCLLAYSSPPITASTNGTAVSGLQLGSLSGISAATSTAVLTANGFVQGWSDLRGGLGVMYECHHFWLNIGNNTASYKPLTWDWDDQLSLNWVVAANGIVTASATNQYNATSNFLACKIGANQWSLYLQTGTDSPPTEIICATTQLQLVGGTLLPY